MALPLPNLDDKTFDVLIDEATRLIPSRAAAWTDHNRHDPGITFIELFGWLAEMQQYYLNRVRDDNYLKFLKLLGTIPRAATPASADVTMRLPSGPVSGVWVPAGTPLRADDVAFETAEALFVVPVTLTKVLSASQDGLQDHTEANQMEGIAFPVFGTTAEAQSRLYLGFDHAFPGNRRLSLTFNLFEAYPVARGQHGDESSAIIPSATIAWEYYRSDRVWAALLVLDDQTRMLSQSGRLFFTAPEDMQHRTIPPLNDDLFWLRATVQQAGYELPPAADTIRLNTVGTVARETLSEVLTFSGTGQPAQLHVASSHLALHGTLLVQVDEGNACWHDWAPQESLAHSGPDDRHYRLAARPEESEIALAFGDGEHGKIPPLGEQNIRLIACQPAFTALRLIGCSNGLPGQAFALDRLPIIAASFMLQVEDTAPQSTPGGGERCWRDWGQVADFDASKPEDVHYVLCPETGEVRFGDGINGAIPPVPPPPDEAYKNIRIIQYQAGGGAHGNVSAGTITRQSATDVPNLQVTNHRAATGGAAAEPLEAAQTRARRELKTPFVAVTSDDFERLARATPGLRVARARAIPLYAPQAPQEPTPAAVTVVVVPYSEAAKPIPSAAFLLTVCRHLDRHRLITTQLHVVRPDYVEVGVQATVLLRAGFEATSVRQRVEAALNAFLHPLQGGPEGTGWPFGRTVYKSEIYQQIEKVDGVDCVENVVLTATGVGITRSVEGNIGIPPQSFVCSGEHQIDMTGPGLACRVEGASR